MEARRDTLSLHEEVLLLALRDEQGTIACGTMYAFALGGALLSELLLAGRIRVESTKKKLVVAVSARPLGDALLDECLVKIRQAKRRASLKTWITRCSQIKQLKHRIAASLCRRRILRADDDKVLLVFTRKIYPEIDPEPEQAILARLREAIFGSSRDLDPRTVVLVSLAHAAGLLKVVFDKRELKERKARLQQISQGDVMGTAAKQAIEAAQAAAAMAAIIPAIVVTTTSSH